VGPHPKPNQTEDNRDKLLTQGGKIQKRKKKGGATARKREKWLVLNRALKKPYQNRKKRRGGNKGKSKTGPYTSRSMTERQPPKPKKDPTNKSVVSWKKKRSPTGKMIRHQGGSDGALVEQGCCTPHSKPYNS